MKLENRFWHITEQIRTIKIFDETQKSRLGKANIIPLWSLQRWGENILLLFATFQCNEATQTLSYKLKWALGVEDMQFPWTYQSKAKLSLIEWGSLIFIYILTNKYAVEFLEK